jgi:hypothetical protein
LLLFWLLITFVFWNLLPPSYESGFAQPRFTFIAAFLGIFGTVFVTEFVGFGLAYVVLGAKPSEITEQLQMLSVPLAWLSAQFLITPAKSFMDICGIMMGNSLLIALPIYLAVKFVQTRLRRSRAIRIDLNNSGDKSDD